MSATTFVALDKVVSSSIEVDAFLDQARDGATVGVVPQRPRTCNNMEALLHDGQSLMAGPRARGSTVGCDLSLDQRGKLSPLLRKPSGILASEPIAALIHKHFPMANGSSYPPLGYEYHSDPSKRGFKSKRARRDLNPRPPG